MRNAPPLLGRRSPISSPIRDRTNLTVRTGALVTRIVVEKGRAVGVEIVEAGGGRRSCAPSARCIVTSGAIGSPKLLLQSGIGPADHLKSVGVAVGARPARRRLATCRTISTSSSSPNAPATTPMTTTPSCTARVWAGLQYLLFKKGPVASSLFETGGFWYADPAARSPDIQFHLGLGSGIEAGVEKLKNAGVTLNSAFLQPALARHGAARRAPIPPTAPLIDPNYWADPLRPRHVARGPAAGARDHAAAGARSPSSLARAPARAGARPRTSELSDYACRTCQDRPSPGRHLQDGHGRAWPSSTRI